MLLRMKLLFSSAPGVRYLLYCMPHFDELTKINAQKHTMTCQAINYATIAKETLLVVALRF